MIFFIIINIKCTNESIVAKFELKRKLLIIPQSISIKYQLLPLSETNYEVEYRSILLIKISIFQTLNKKKKFKKYNISKLIYSLKSKKVN